MLSSPSIAVNKWAVVRVGAVLALAAIVMISNSAPNGIFAHPHDDAGAQTHIGAAADTDEHIHIHYAENGMGEVRDFYSKDPEGFGIEWNVRGVDAADFDIDRSTGVLTFRDSPDYENPTDRGLNLGADTDGTEPDFTSDGDFKPGDNNYQITVSATEMRAGANAPLPAKRTDIALTVIILNADDTGDLTLQWLQPEVGTPITATLTDPDTETDPVGSIMDPVWMWYTSKAADPVVGNLFHWTVITDASDNSYTPVATADEGDYLWVHVEYTDPHGGSKEAEAKSENPVRAEVSANANASPDFPDDTDTRTVPESMAVGDPVGDPVAATDTDNDTLTYELDNDILPTNPLAAASDLQFFGIDRETGQIEVAKELDFDAVGGGRATGAVAGTYMVRVRATDPSGLADNIMITITAENVNEDPIVTGRAELTVVEGTIDITDPDAVLVYTSLPDAPGGQSPDPTNQQNEYVYEDPDYLDSIARWTLEGDDAGAFDQSGRFEPRYIQFKVAPDYENPTDANSDNVYEVTLVATDTDPLRTGAGVGKVNVWVTVENADEAGKVVFTEGETAYLNEMLVAQVQDPDDKGGDLGEPYQGVHIVTWQWSRSLDDDNQDAPFLTIDGATENRYTPEDDDRGYYLRVTATYIDPHSAADDAGTPLTDERITATGSLKTVMATTENVVRLAPGPASVPTFDETGTVTREVAENTMPGGNVGAPVKAMGPETLVHSLEGSDAKYFNIDPSTAQITVGGDVESTGNVIEAGTDPELDYDDPMKKQRFSVTVKVEVTGGDASQKAEVDVNIVVTDVDESPMITDADVDELPMTAIMYAEIDEEGAPNTAAIATYVGTDPEEDTISWDLRGADASFFTINGGVLRFVNSPDYENPKDVEGLNTATADAEASDNEYEIVIRAIASRASGDTGPAETVDTPVTVTVADVDEDGDVVISWLQPEVGIVITASLTDPDGSEDDILPVTDTKIDAEVVTWAWAVSKVGANILDIDNEDHWGDVQGNGVSLASYTPVALSGAESRHLRVTATYTDRNGNDKMAREMSANPVQAEGLGARNQSPDFDGANVERSVAETAEVGDDVPGPVVATVKAPSSTDILTYGLRAFTADDVGDTGLPDPVVGVPEFDLASFAIEQASGQITVARKLNFERGKDSDDPSIANDGKYVVVVEVFDPSADTMPDPTIGYDFIVVVITAEDINEDPVLSGRPELTIAEIDSGGENAGNPDFDGNPGATVNVYNVVDEDRRAATNEWSLEGEDKDQFQLIGNVGRTLVFRNQPNYETPADADGDNVYKVTVVTLDGAGGRGEFDVCIAVMNINEAGKITLRDEDSNELVQPYAHGPIIADLTDPDEGVTLVTWTWTRSDLNQPFIADDTISDPMSATYTPTNVDTSFFLRVTATYNDAVDTIGRMAEKTTVHAVLEVEDLKREPKFSEETATRMVAENAPSTTFVGDHLSLPMDPDDPQGESLTYSLEGDDAEFFELLSTDSGADGMPYTDDDTYSTQIRVKLHDEAHDLNHEAEGRNGVYEVVLKVTDESDLEDTITVTITVMDRNEAPSIPVEATDSAITTPANNAPEFAAATDTREVAENTAAGENIGAPVTATDADAGDTLTYTLSGADAASFDIEDTTGQLMTKAALDFETPADTDTDNAYEVTVTASDGNTAADATIAVTITVTDLAEGSELNPYDTDNSGKIEGPEVIQAVKDYFADTITGPEVIEVVKLYFAGRSS